ncbi:ABC transporter ATP-binding protein [Nonomuraea soli]|uniref:ATP-binding cassette subfamily B protein n=1 Tax=Nonomuraea soli TaxID=1032476 RepID=A0A7W0HTC3_9ACTN|nr:ABC transporter ATP-binding protein [Nonomuraea soli]MBA2894895.1 ATP-binding cassette subfamily B protein [Nonomuraea soli]
MRDGDRLMAGAARHSGPWPVLLALAAVAGAAAELAMPYLIGRAIDTGGAPGWLIAAVAVVIGCECLAVLARGLTGARAAAWIRRAVVRHVLDAGTLMRTHAPGELTLRAGLNADEAGRAPEAMVSAVALVVPTAGALIALTLIDPRLTLALGAGIVAIVLILRAFLRTGGALSGAYQEVQGRIAARLAEALTGARTIAAAGTARREAERVLAPLPELRAHGLALWRATAAAGVRAGVMTPVLEVAVLAAGGWLLAAGQLTVGELYAAARYAVLGSALGGALGYVGQLARARSAASRVAEVLAVPPMAHGTRELPPGPGTLEFRGIPAGDLVVAGGSCVALVGRSGAGKTMLAELAGRLRDPEHGTVLIDGVPLPELSRESLRAAVGYAFERPVLLGETVGAAIGMGGADLGGAARAAQADTFVRLLPEGFMTPLTATPMSGGERQRLGLARALAAPRRLLVLDDATSSLDTVTERRVSDALFGQYGGRTRLVVAHRATTAARADRVVWVQEGRIRAAAPHGELWEDPDYRAVFAEGTL